MKKHGSGASKDIRIVLESKGLNAHSGALRRSYNYEENGINRTNVEHGKDKMLLPVSKITVCLWGGFPT